LNLALEVLSCQLFHAKRPLHMRELREALTVEKGERCHEEEDLPDPDKLIEVCEGLVAYDEKSGIARFAHYTVQEFLREPSTIGRLCRIVDIATSCLTYMMYDVFNRDWTSRDKWLIFRYSDNFPRFHIYAARYWVDYMREMRNGFEEIQELAVQFLVSNGSYAAMRYNKYSGYDEAYNDEPPLHLLARAGLGICCEWMLQAKVEFEQQYKPYRMPLISRGKLNLLDSVDRLHRIWNIEVTNCKGRTALHIAAMKGNEGVVQILLSAGGRVNCSDYDDRTPLILAADFGETKILKLLLQVQDISVSLQDSRSYTALDYAAQNIQTPESCEVLKDLIRAMKQSKGRAGPALVIATKHDNIDVVSLLLSEMPQQMREYLGSALCAAASERQYETIMLLLIAGAPVNRPNLNETAPLYLALMAYAP